MKGSIFTLILFGSGCIAGAFMEMPDYLPDLSACILYFMMLQVGINIGRSGNLKEIINTVGPKVLLIPVATITGTLLFSALTGLLLSRWSIADCMAVGSGMGYYSLSSVLITQLKTPSLGIQLATELGTIALLSNIFREMLVLIGAPLLRRWLGPFGPLAAGGATTADITMPAILRVSGQELVAICLFHGLLIDMSVPFLVSFFARKAFILL